LASQRARSVLAAVEILLRSRDDRTDRDLLREFLDTKAEAAFAALVRRHGPMVMRVCRRILGNVDDADDAAQATFLVLVTKANACKARATLGDWLFGVARRTALNARRLAARRREMEKRMVRPIGQENTDIADLLPLLDEELARLPEKYRLPIVLCDLEGQSRKVAAQQLRWPEGSVASRLARGRQLLAERLTKRGVALTASGLAAGLASQAASADALAATQIAAAAAQFMARGSLTGTTIISANVLALTEGALKTMLLSKLKIMIATVIVSLSLTWGIGNIINGSIAAKSPQAEKEAAQKASKPKTEKAAAAAAADSPKDEPKQARPKDDPAPIADQKPEKVTIRGRVLDADGKALAHADVAVVGWVEDVPRQQRALPSLMDGKADREGRFQIELPERATGYTRVYVAATSAGRALHARHLDANSWQTEVELRLQAEHGWRGQFFDLQGLPAARVRVEISGRTNMSVLYDAADPSHALSGFTMGLYPKYWNPERKLERWRTSATTDAQGQFVLHGLHADWLVALKIDDERFGPQEFIAAPAKQNGDKGFVGILAPKRVLEGMVTSAEDGKPVPNAELYINTRPSEVELNPGYHVESRADESGRFRVTLPAGKFVEVTTHAPTGSPLLGLRKSLNWPDSGALKQEMNLALPQGVVVRGIVKENPSGKPVPGTKVEFHPNRDDNSYYRRDVVRKTVVCDSDGRFGMTVPLGRGHLLIDGPTLDYLHNEITTQSLDGLGIYPNRRNYYDAILPLQLKPQTTRHEISATLRRGVTLTGSVVGPDGQPVREAIMLCRSYLEAAPDWNGTHTKRVTNGRFSLPGCDPERISEVFFVDEKNRWGGVVKLSGKDVGKPIAVRLDRCGSASLRLIDEKGNAIPKVDTWAYFVITPGADFYSRDLDSIDPTTGQSPIPVETACAPYKTCRGNTDSEGRITFHCLMPGATYWLGGQSAITGGAVRFPGDFRVEPGQGLDLGDIQVKARKR
jgi:RNA polymerase sigma factor (sigma-70 family)